MTGRWAGPSLATLLARENSAVSLLTAAARARTVSSRKVVSESGAGSICPPSIGAQGWPAACNPGSRTGSGDGTEIER